MDSEASSGLVLMAAAAVALILANSPWSADWFHLLHVKIGPLSLTHWVNDALMAVFFLLVGLEIKREFLEGQLSGWDRRILPGAAALAGMAMPAIIFLLVNRSAPANHDGWAIPAATDIAFALGVLAILGRHAPAGLKPFLTAVAVIDDLGAVVIIAGFYTAGIAAVPLAIAAALVLVLFLLNRMNVGSLWPYLLTGAALWTAIFLSGIHATVAGVLLALFIPLRGKAEAVAARTASPLFRLEHALHPWVAYAIVPIFGLANAGVDLRGLSPAILLDPLPLGVALGLFLGKPLGIFTSCQTLIGLGLATRPQGSNAWHMLGISILCGIGFTMSLFIGALAFGEGSVSDDHVKIGVIGGSLASALLGALVLRLSSGNIARATD